MNTPSRGGYERGSRPARPGDLAARTAEQKRREAAAVEQRKADTADLSEIRRAALREGIDAGFDAGYAAALKQLRDAGIDTDAVLALDADDAEDAGDE